jgi:tetratricopeptide (TPR) repeat protein/predicted Ser/Thr protein kinase
MQHERWRQVEQLYLAAVDKSPRDRAAFLAQACAGDSALRQEVESLLAYAPGADSLLQAAVEEAAAQIPAVEKAPPLPREIPKLGRYQIVDTIGKGGMGVVYRAIDPAIGRSVAIKTILVDETEGENSPMRARLLRESQAAGRLSHPHIVAIHDVGEADRVAYIVMEYVEGRTLDQAMRDHPSPQAGAEALRIVEECASALDYAHSRGVVHRDIKPANIMLEVNGAVKIADFGIAKLALASSLTKTAVIVGSPHYMAPEQWRGEAVTGRADQYALATVAYTMLTGREPFIAESIASLAAMTLYRDPPATITLNAGWNPAVDDALQKALSKSAEARYATCTEFARALRNAFEGASCAVTARTGKGSRWIAAAAGAAGIATLSIAAWFVYSHRVAAPPSPAAKAAVAAPVAQSHTAPSASTPTPSTPAAKVPVHADIEAEADQAVKQSKYAEAVKDYTQAIDANPDYHSYFGRASAYRQLQQYDQAIADYSKAIALKPDRAAAYFDRAICQTHLGFDNAAAEDYDRALELDPTNAHTWNARGLIYLKKGGYNKAKDSFTKAIALDAGFVEAYENRARAELKLKDEEGAKQDNEKAAALRQEKTKK